MSNSGQDVSSLVQRLTQYLEYQKSLGVTHMEVSPDTRKILRTWGTPAFYKNRFQAEGDPDSRVMLIDGQGIFFKGGAGALLTKILSAMHLQPDQVYICNTADLTALRAGIANHRPDVIITLGQPAAAFLLGKGVSLSDIQGTFQSFDGIAVMPTRHPESLLKDPGLKRHVWEDMKQVMAKLGV